LGTYKVEYLEDVSDVDITDFIHVMDDTHLYSDGRISTAAFTLQAEFGDFITQDNGGTTPILKQYDKIRLTYTAATGDFYSKIFEIMTDLGQLSREAEYLLPLTLEGRERNFALIPFSGYFDPPEPHNEMIEKINIVYLNSKGTNQPFIFLNNNELPEYNPNFWDFQYIDNCLDAIKSVIRLADQSVAAGGGGDRFAIIFEDVDKDILIFDIISQGNNPSSETIILTGDAVFNPIQRISKVKQPLTGTAVIARGRPGSGGTPKDGDIYRSRLEFFQRISIDQIYDDTITYAVDAFANQGGIVFQALNEVTGDRPPSANWQTILAEDFIGSTIQYSRFTIDKAALYRNECAFPEAAFDPESETSPKMLDYNIFIDDVETKRDWVHFRSITDIIVKTDPRSRYLWRSDVGTNAKVFEGIRILVDTSLGTPADAFAEDNFGTGAGFDPNSRPYADNQCVFTNEKWFVIKEHEDFDQTLSRFDGLWEFNASFDVASRFPASDLANANRRLRGPSTGTPDGWKNLDGQFLANDCLHSPSSITNIDGLINPVAKGGGFYTDNSAVRIIYEYGRKDEMDFWAKALDNIAGIITASSGFLGKFAISATVATFNLFTTPYYANVGWWITLSAPFPVSTFNGITEEVGELYGGKTFGQLDAHSYFDKFNERVALSGLAGWNEEDSEELMEITGVTFLYKLDILANGTRIPFTGQIPTSYWVMDSNGTLWKNTKPYRFLGDMQRMTFNFGDFTPVYRARSPFGISNIVTNIIVPELEIRERILPARIVMQGFQLEMAYDEHGRYFPNFIENIIKPTIFAMFSSTNITTKVEFVGDFDYFQWVKTPIAIAKDESFNRIIFPEIKDYPNISNIEQLTRAALADIDVSTFQYEQYTLTQNDVADFALQNTIYLREKFLIPDSDLLIADVTAWNASTDYDPNNIVKDAGIIYTCIKQNTNEQPPNTELWVSEGSVAVPNTRKLVGGEIVLSVTNGRDWQRVSTLPRRIPRVTA